MFGPWTNDRFVFYSLVVSAAATASLVVLIGILARIGWPNPTTAISIGLAAVFTVASFGVAWMWPVFGLFLGTAFLLTTVAVGRTIGRHGWLQWATAGAFPAGAMVFVLVNSMGWGPVDEYGGYPLADTVGFTVAAFGMVIGMLEVGRWLLTERVSDPSPVAVA